MKIFLITLFSILGFNQLQAQLFVNEVSQGTGGNPANEYVELVVVGNPTCSDSCMDIRGWILDDNNGFFGTSGIAAGHIKFANIPQWECVPYGSIILLYNNQNVFPGIVSDPTDANNDLVYVLDLISNLLESNVTIPANGTPVTTYTGSTYATGGGYWNLMAMKNTGDLVQLVSPANINTSFFSVGWGTGVSGTNYYSGTGSAANTTMFMANTVDDNPFNSANWSNSAANIGTPGYENNANNLNWLNSLRVRFNNTITNDTINGCIGDSILVGTSWIKNNYAFSDTFNVMGCDSISLTEIIFSSTVNNYDTIKMCSTDSILIEGNWIKNNYAYSDTFNVGGCDSISFIEIYFSNSKQEYDTIKLCDGDSVLVGSDWIKDNYTYSDTFNIGGCDSIIFTEVIFSSNESVSIIGEDKICLNTEGILLVENNFKTYLWNTGSTAKGISISDEGLYSVIVTTEEDCKAEASIYVSEQDCYSVCIPYVSNTFTPNDDGVNDRFSPSFNISCSFEDYELAVFNKWGNQIFICKTKEEFWDGSENGVKSALGVYLWKLKYKLTDKIEYVEKTGIISIIQ
jgi:gliding motility-associated-like protein